MSYVIGNMMLPRANLSPVRATLPVVTTLPRVPITPPGLERLLTLDVMPSAIDLSPSPEEEECARFQAALADAGLYDGPIDGDLFRVADIRNQLRAEHGFPLVSSNISITQDDFSALEREKRSMESGEGPPPAIIPDAPAQGGGSRLFVPGLIAAALLLL